MQPRKLAISLVILLVIGLHAVPVISYEGNRQRRWPILAWAMYARSLPPGPIQTTVRRIVGVSHQGRQEYVTARLVGLSQTALRKLYLQPMWLGDSSAARELLHRLNRERTDPLVELRVEGERLTLSEGVVHEKKLPVVAYRMSPGVQR